MNDNLFHLVSLRNDDPDRPFVITEDGATITYGEALARARRYAAALEGLGVEPGDRVAVQVEKSAEVLMLYLGCLAAGAVYLPLNTGYTEAEVGYFLGDAEPKVAVCRPGSKAAFDRLAEDAAVAHVLTLDADGSGSIADLAGESGSDFETVSRKKDDLAAILYTSGTTGRSKGAMLTHDNLNSNALALVDIWRFTGDDVLLHALPVFHTHGLFVATNVTLMTGGRMIFLPQFDADAMLRWLPEATAMMGVPTFYSRLLAHEGFTRDVAAHIRVFISGSAPLSPELHKDFEKRTGHAILERYGMTETNMNTSNPYDGARRPGTVGFPLPGVEIRIAEPKTGKVMPDGEVGVIEIRGPNVFKGYWRMKEKTAAEFRDDGFFISGDLGLIDDQGYLNIVGRDKDLVISGGFNVYPAEVEAALDALPEVAESAVIGLPHPDFGEGVAAALILRKDAEITEQDVRSRLERELAKYKVPKRVFFLDLLPRNAMGKIQKNVLRESYKNTFT